MGFFTRDEGKKDEPSAKKAESDRIAAAAKVEVKAPPKKAASMRTFVLGLRPNVKLENLPAERLEEGLKAVLPKGSKLMRLDGPLLVTDLSIRFFEITLAAQDMPEVLGLLLDKGLLDGLVQVTFEQCVVVCEAVGKSAQLVMVGEMIDRSGIRFAIKTDSPEILIQYPPIDVHKRWLADDDYRAAYGRWRTQRSDDAKPPRWHAGWPPAASEESGPPWVRLRPRDGSTNEYVVDFEDSMLLRFAFQGAVIRIERFNLKAVMNKLTGEFAVYRSLPLSPESIPKDAQDRMNREPERFKSVRESGKFGPSFDLVRLAYEELGGDYYQLEVPTTSARSLQDGPIGTSTPIPMTPPSVEERAAPSASLQSGPLPRSQDLGDEPRKLPPPRMGSSVNKGTGVLGRGPVKPLELPKVDQPRPESRPSNSDDD